MGMFSRRRFLNLTGSATAISIFTGLRPVRVAQAAGDDKSAWDVKGLFMEACNCEAMCPCVVGNAPTADVQTNIFTIGGAPVRIQSPQSRHACDPAA
jgi:hypothetical protein